MKTNRVIALAAMAGVLSTVMSAHGEQMSAAEATRVAQNHVRLLTAENGWSASIEPQVMPAQSLTRGGKILGYYCAVKPQGFVVLSLYKEVNPIKAFSDSGDLDPQRDEGMVELLMDDLARDLKRITARLGRAPESQDQLDSFVEFDTRHVFNLLALENFAPELYARPQSLTTGAGMDYKEGDVLLTTRWHQFPPFNNNCPNTGCSYPSEYYWNENAVVGCVATGGAQIVNYWHYCAAPVAFDWPKMRNYYDPDKYFAQFETEEGTATDAELAAVAGLSYFMGLMLDTDYGCPDGHENGSAADTEDMEDVLKDLGYSDNIYVADYDDFDTSVDWYNAMKNQLNLNRVMQMGLTGHSVVVDGWKTSNGVRYYHINYGWRSSGSNAWYALNGLHDGGDGDPTNDFIVTAIVPALASGSQLNASNYGADGFRYWDRDATATDTTFQAGNRIQVLRSGCYVRCNGGSSQAIRFYGSSGHDTYIYLDGDPAGKTRVKVKGGGMKIHSGAEMAIY